MASTPAAVPVLLITGATGVGKTLVASEVSWLLRQEPSAGVEHARLDWDTLTNSTPPMSHANAMAALAGAWDQHQRAGAHRLVLAASLERREMFDDIPRAIPGAQIEAFCLVASERELARRLRRREMGGSGVRYINDIAADLRVYEILREQIERVETQGRSPVEVATEVVQRSGWLAEGRR